MNKNKILFYGALLAGLIGVVGFYGVNIAGAFDRGDFDAILKHDDFEQHVSHKHQDVCDNAGKDGKDNVFCHAKVLVDNFGKIQTFTTPSGYGPAQFLGAYNLSGIANSSTSPIIAIVDAYDHPSILSDLNKYSTTFGIPTLPACSGSISASSVPCFQKVNQTGGTSFPKVNSGWALEISLDVEAAHAICQNCKILLVEAKSASYSDLMAAFDRAVAMGAKIISNSYGSNEFSSETSFDSHFNKSGLAITFSSGDSGYGASYPAASKYVTAVGGTTLNVGAGNVYAGESVWSGTGSGCSAYESKPSWQTDMLCKKRTIADVSADADPNTGAAVYDSVAYSGQKGWFQVGGTSLSAPIIAGVYALAGGVGSTALGNSLPYSQNPSINLHDITIGSNGSCRTYLCSGTAGYDGPTGLGTPSGLGAF